jgi:mannose-6-phosphate isomerase class I
VRCDKFVLHRWSGHEERELPKGELCILIVVQGSLQLAANAFRAEYRIGDTVIVPASFNGCSVSAASDSVYLECHLASSVAPAKSGYFGE